MEDSQIIKLYWQRSQDAIAETDKATPHNATCAKVEYVFAVVKQQLRFQKRDTEVCENRLQN